MKNQNYKVYISKYLCVHRNASPSIYLSIFFFCKVQIVFHMLCICHIAHCCYAITTVRYSSTCITIRMSNTFWFPILVF